MEVEKISSSIVTNNYYNDDDDVELPGFRFHPTDEELIGFYLKRKVENREMSLQLIKQIDIYKYDPWDLPKGNNNGEKEWYFYCKRGRKYKNSVRPNRVTAGSGFWKATGIDRPIYSSSNNNHGKCIIGLKKSLVYYRGSAGKGTKTDWQMHEFRLPDKEAETWTLCRILKRNAPYRKSIPDCKEAATKQPSVNMDALSSKLGSNNNIDAASNNSQIYISFSSIPVVKQNTCTSITENKHQFVGQQSSGSSSQSTTAAAASSSSSPLDFNEWLEHGNWDELKSIFELS